MKIMYISRRFEDNVCAATHLQALQELFDDVYVIDLSLKNRKNTEHWIAYSKVTPFTRIRHCFWLYPAELTRERIKEICSVIRRREISVVFIDEGYYGKITREIKRSCPDVKVAAFYHDISVSLYTQRLKEKGISFLKIFLPVVYGERLNAQHADINITLNCRDAELYKAAYRKSPEMILPMGVSEPILNAYAAGEFSFSRKNSNMRYLLIVGTYYTPNLNGLRWFIDNVYSYLPDYYRLLIVGRGMERFSHECRHDGIIVIGAVENLAPYYNNADIVVAPVFGGGGMKQKTAEAIAYGKITIGTTESIQGYEEILKITHDGERVFFGTDDAKEQIEILRRLEEKGMCGFIPELHEAYEQFFSEAMVRETLRKALMSE